MYCSEMDESSPTFIRWKIMTDANVNKKEKKCKFAEFRKKLSAVRLSLSTLFVVLFFEFPLLNLVLFFPPFAFSMISYSCGTWVFREISFFHQLTELQRSYSYYISLGNTPCNLKESCYLSTLNWGRGAIRYFF